MNPPEGADERFQIDLDLRQRIRITGTLKDLYISCGIPIDRLAQVLRGEDALTDEEEDSMWDYLAWGHLLDSGDGKVKLLLDGSTYELTRDKT